jgi:hypothetical protein
LLDANVLIDANRDYYPIERVPEFWDWLEHHGAAGKVKIPLEIYEEVRDGKDDLASWIKTTPVTESLRYAEEVDVELVSKAVSEGYAPDLTDDEILKLGRDPFLLAYALASPSSHCIVTTEVSRPSKRRGNRRLPDVARDFGIESCNTFEFTRRLDFRTNWRP